MTNSRIEFAPYIIKNNWSTISLLVLCRDCNFLSGSLITNMIAINKENCCKACSSTNLMILPEEFTEKFKDKLERKIPDAEMLQILLQMD